MRETRDRDLLERLLRDPALGGPVWAGYALGDLDDAWFPRTRWLVADDEAALVLVFRWGEDGATALTFGDGPACADLLGAADLPARFDLHVREVDAAAVAPRVQGALTPCLRLGLTRDALRPAPEVGLAARPLAPGDGPAARALYAHYPANVFDPARLGDGAYLGAWDGERLVGVAGTHVASTRTRAAAIGDVVVHPDLRGRGVGAWLTAAHCARLLARVDLVVLNVARGNAAARRAYERVGFGAAVPYLEGAGVSLR
ncbi:MAG: GNAT family N-acetyltransferase [Planctomycetes bacterium]|nr:GNAT family N-acetyltransferase [Planctomycetota bacterium]